jgi:limonene 1,2-monooxygenase
MMGVGPGALASDAHMMGIDHTVQRARMDEALGVILRLFTDTEPITYKSDWFELNEALLQLRPYQRPYMPVAVASVQSPAGVALAGKHGAAVLTITVPRDPSPNNASELRKLWDVAEESAEANGQEVHRDDWRLVVPTHLAETRKEAREEARMGAGRYLREYSEGTNGRRPIFDGPLDKVIDFMADHGFWIVGTPDDCVEGIKRLEEQSGGYGGFLVQTIDWAPRDKMLHSYELLARYVMPQFQGTAASTAASNRWAATHKEALVAGRARAIEQAREDYATSVR